MMSQTVAKFYHTKMKSMPQVEAVLSGVGGGGGGAGASAAKKGTPSRTGPGGAGKKVMPSPGDSSSSTDTPTKGQNFSTVLNVKIKKIFTVGNYGSLCPFKLFSRSGSRIHSLTHDQVKSMMI